MKDFLKWFVIYAAIAMIFLGAVGAGIALIGRQTHEAGPVVDIHTPVSGQQVEVGEVVLVQSTAREDFGEISCIELYETNDEHSVLIQSDKPLESAASFSTAQGWQPRKEGVYRLIVLARNSNGVSSQAFVEVEAVPGGIEREPVLLLPDANLTLPLPGGASLAEAGETSEGMGEPGESSEEAGLLDPPQWNFGDFLADQITSTAHELFLPPLALPPVPLEFAAVDLQIGEDYDSIYCFAALGDQVPERIPETGYLDTLGSRHWDIAAELGGQNTVIVQVEGENEPLHIWAECYGNRGENSYRIGTLDTFIPSQYWDGWLLNEAGTNGKGGFNLDFWVKRITAPFSAPYDLSIESWAERTYLSWKWDGHPEDIDFFMILRNGVYVAWVSPELRMYQMDPWWLIPPCGEEYEYAVIAKKGGCAEGEISAPSNIQRLFGTVCDTAKNDILRLSLVPTCNYAGIRVFVRYLYQVPSGPVYIGLRTFQGGWYLSDIQSTYARIEQGEGAVQLAMTNHSNQNLVSDRIDVFLFDEEGSGFYVERFDREINWQAADPDLVIESARVDYDTQELVVEVFNDGCELAQTPELVVESVYGKILRGEFDDLGGKKTAVWRYPIFPDDLALWGEGFTVTVNPDQTCRESEYYNNTYTVGPSQVEYIHIYQIDIHDDHDGWARGPGELNFFFSAASQQDGTSTNLDFIPRSWQWGTGMHEANVRLVTSLENGEDLILRVTMYESDCYGAEIGDPDDGGDIYLSHSFDPASDGSWKGGGEFSASSDKGDYTIYYRIIMAE